MSNTHTAEIGLLILDECTARSGELKLEVGRDRGQKTGKESSIHEAHFQNTKGPASETTLTIDGGAKKGGRSGWAFKCSGGPKLSARKW